MQQHNWQALVKDRQHGGPHNHNFGKRGRQQLKTRDSTVLLLHTMLLHRNCLLLLKIFSRHECTKDFRQALQDRGSTTQTPVREPYLMPEGTHIHVLMGCKKLWSSVFDTLSQPFYT